VGTGASVLETIFWKKVQDDAKHAGLPVEGENKGGNEGVSGAA